MKKETRFSAKCERFIKFLVQLLPIIVLFCYFVCFVGFYFNDNLIVFNYSDVDFLTFLDYFFNDFFDYLFNYITYWPWYFSFGLNSIFLELAPLFGLDENTSYFLFNFIFCYMGYLVFVEIIWLFKNVLMFLPKIGNYFISKWSGD